MVKYAAIGCRSGYEPNKTGKNLLEAGNAGRAVKLALDDEEVVEKLLEITSFMGPLHFDECTEQSICQLAGYLARSAFKKHN